MPRYRRLAPPGTLQHVIARFINHDFRLAGAEEREDYLTRLARALSGTDWVPLSFALMSSHVHLALIAGTAAASSWLKPLHTGVASALNRAHRRLGPVFAERPSNVLVPVERAAHLLAYLHNNPVRAAVVPIPSTPTGPRTVRS